MCSRNPFLDRPSYKTIATLPLSERVRCLREPAFRQQLLSEQGNYRNAQTKMVAESFHRMFRLGDPPDYEPPAEKSIAAIAQASGRNPAEVALDVMLERDGHEMLIAPVTDYLSGDASAIWEVMHH